MRVGNYSLMIPEGVERDSGHVAVDHGRHYTLRLVNHDHRRCDAEVAIDGKPIGGFRLHPHGSLTLERGPDDAGRFTFYAVGTDEAAKADAAGVAAPDRGLIRVRFVPERRPPEPVHQVRARGMGLTAFSGGAGGQSAGGGRAMAAPSGFAPEAGEKTAAGVTGLSGHSDQRFVTVAELDRDEAAAVTVTLRLVVRDAGPRPLRPAADRANPVPAPVE